MVFDSCRNRIVLFGGGGFAETWEYDGADWTRATPNASPPGGTHLAGMAFDSARCKVVLFGGSPVFEATWEYDGATWTTVPTITSPGVRWGHEMEYDASRQRIVLFGGYNPANNSLLNDTWEYDGSDWVQVNLERGPGPDEQFAMAYDSSRGRVLMLIFGSTWQYMPRRSDTLTMSAITTMLIQKRVLSRKEYHWNVDSTPSRSFPNRPSDACSSPPSTITETDHPGE